MPWAYEYPLSASRRYGFVTASKLPAFRGLRPSFNSSHSAEKVCRAALALVESGSC
jgi:hypothetical protein